VATIEIGKRPDVTVDSAVEAFQRHFAGRYEVYKTQVLLVDFVVKKSGSIGVSVRVHQKDHGTTFVYTGFSPNTLIRALTSTFAYLIFRFLIFRGAMTALEGEVGDFIRSEYKVSAAG
jgi:hypothetical protein